MSSHVSLNPGRLRTARQLRRLTGTDLAEAMNVAPTTITAWEKGRREPDPYTIRQLAQVLRVPVHYLESGEDLGPAETQDVFFRRLRRTATIDRDQARALAAAIDQLRELILRYVDVPGPNVPQFPLADGGVDPDDASSAPAHAAAECRRAWGMGNGPIPSVVDLLEHHGVWVSLLDGELSRAIDAFSYWRDGWAHVVLSPAKKDAYRSRFDAAHELGHLVMHHQGADGTEAEIERQANEFASAFLMPAETWVSEAPRSTNPHHYLEWKPRWKVSVAAMLYRSHRLGLLDESRYKSAMVRYSQLGWRTGEPGMEAVLHEQPKMTSSILSVLAPHGVTLATLQSELGLPPDLMELITSLVVSRVSRPSLRVV